LLPSAADTVTNSGSIAGQRDGVGFNGVGVVVNNAGGTISGGKYGVSNASTVTNHGVIIGSSTAHAADGVDLEGPSGSLYNSGTIQGSRNGISVGGHAHGATVTNTGTILGGIYGARLVASTKLYNELGGTISSVFADGLSGTGATEVLNKGGIGLVSLFDQALLNNYSGGTVSQVAMNGYAGAAGGTAVNSGLVSTGIVIEHLNGATASVTNAVQGTVGYLYTP
jgi:hypothetical protein